MSSEAEFDALEHEVVAALAAHQRWRAEMRVASEPGAVAARIAPIEDCPLTGWLEGRMPQRFRETELYAKTMMQHAAFHEAMDAIVRRDPDGLRRFARAAIVLKSSLDDWLTLARKR